jgi:hypothetical protein
MTKVNRRRKECIERIEEHQELKEKAVEQGKMKLAMQCQAVITEMLWVLEEDFVEDIPELNNNTSSKQGNYPSHYV